MGWQEISSSSRASDPDRTRFCHALAAAYAQAAQVAGHTVRQITVAETEIAFCGRRRSGKTPSCRQQSILQQTIGWADHLVVIYPLWLGSMPAMLKRVFSSRYSGRASPSRASIHGHGRGCSMASRRASSSPWECRPGFTAGIFSPTASRAWSAIFSDFPASAGRETLIGGVEAGGAPARARWLETVRVRLRWKRPSQQ